MWGSAGLGLAVLAIAAGAGARQVAVAASPETAFELVGHNPLNSRGMNAAPALYDHYLYVGNRTDGQYHHTTPGILIVDVANPSAPAIVGEIPPGTTLAETSRELRVWPEKKLLMVMNFGCSEAIHACASLQTATGQAGVQQVSPTIRFYDLANPVSPDLLATYQPPVIEGSTSGARLVPHEMFLWTDPKSSSRAILYFTSPTETEPRANLVAVDVSRAREGAFTDLALWVGTDEFPDADVSSRDIRLHSISVSADGARTYLAYLGGGFLVLDTSDLARGAATPKMRLVTKPADRVAYPGATDAGTHSAVKVFGRPLVLLTDEVYGDLIDVLARNTQDHGCPWGWMRLVDVANEAKPKVLSEFKMPENEASYCDSADGRDAQNTTFTSYSAHNPTVVRDVAFVTWHSSGLVAIDIANPRKPELVGHFRPEPLISVTTEDPALSQGRNKIVMWSYPIIHNGLIYVVDVRNGLYVLRYRGRHAPTLESIGFLEGNSNLGDARVLEASVLGTRRTSAGTSGPRSAPRRPVPARRLPSTGTADAGSAALLLVAAAVLARRLRRHA